MGGKVHIIKDVDPDLMSYFEATTYVGGTTSTPQHNTRGALNVAATSQQEVDPSRQSSTPGPSTQSSTPTGPSTQPVRGQRSNMPGQRGKARGKTNAPHSGFGNWNGVGMFNQFRAPMQTGANNGTQVQINNFSNGGNIQMKVHNTRYGSVVFSSQSRSNKFVVVTDNGAT